MKKIFVLLLSLSLAIQTSLAQTQKGYVKTKGRLGSNGVVMAGKRISGATVLIKGRSAVLSQSNGTFSFPVPAQNFYLQNVQKQGYVLTDPEILSKPYTYSSNDMILVMETPEEQLEEQLDAASRIRTTLTSQLQKKESEIKKLKDDKKISIEKYQELRKELLAAQQGNERLVNEMVESYSKIDYDQLDDFSKQVSDFILNGELMKADSLLKTKGSIEDRIKRLEEHKNVNKNERYELEKRQEQLAKSEFHEKKETEDIAQDCYYYYTKCRMLQQNDSAAYYLEKRALLDTLSFDYVWQCGSYFLDERKFEKAKYYLELLVRNTSLAPVDMGMALNDLSLCYSYMGLDSLGRETIHKSLVLREQLAKEEPEKYNVSVALASSNYAAQNALSIGGNKDVAYKYFLIGMGIYKKLMGYTHFFSVNLANAEENYSELLMRDSLFDDAEKYLLHSYNIRKEYAEKYPQLYNINKDISVSEIGKLIGQIDCDSFIATRECKMIIIAAAEKNKEQMSYSAQLLANLYFKKEDFIKCRYYLSESNRNIEELFETNRQKFLPDITSVYIDNAYFCLNVISDFHNANVIAEKLKEVLTNNDTYLKKFSKELALSDMWVLKGRIGMAMSTKETLDCFEESEKILTNQPDSIRKYLKFRLDDTYKYLAVAHLQQKDIHGAIECCQKRIDNLDSIKETNNSVILSLCVANYDLALLYLQSDSIGRAMHNLTIAKEKMEENASLFSVADFIQLYYYYGGVLIHENRYSEALTVFKKAQSLSSNITTNEQMKRMVEEINQIVSKLKTIPTD